QRHGEDARVGEHGHPVVGIRALEHERVDVVPTLRRREDDGGAEADAEEHDARGVARTVGADLIENLVKVVALEEPGRAVLSSALAMRAKVYRKDVVSQ